MAFGLGRLGWPPELFWAATPREIAAAIQAHKDPQADAPPPRSVLAHLMASYPDQ